jgi:hypothetical protein
MRRHGSGVQNRTAMCGKYSSRTRRAQNPQKEGAEPYTTEEELKRV